MSYPCPIPARALTRSPPLRISFLNTDQFVNAIAPKGDLTKIGRTQFATLFPVADSTKRGLVSWDDFVIFQTILKRPDADYWIAFEYFDVCVFFLDCSFISLSRLDSISTWTRPRRLVVPQCRIPLTPVVVSPHNYISYPVFPALKITDTCLRIISGM